MYFKRTAWENQRARYSQAHTPPPLRTQVCYNRAMEHSASWFPSDWPYHLLHFQARTVALFKDQDQSYPDAPIQLIDFP